MASFDIVVEGYAEELPGGGWRSTSTAVLVRDADRIVLVDPGMDTEALMRTLFEIVNSGRDIDLVALTHGHVDHIVDLRHFAGADVWMEGFLVQGNVLMPHEEKLPGTSIRVLHTPGHCAEHYSFLFNCEKQGRVAIAGDVFWWTEGQEQLVTHEALLALEDSLAEDWNELQRSRTRLLEEADYIIPGHGKPFKLVK